MGINKSELFHWMVARPGCFLDFGFQVQIIQSIWIKRVAWLRRIRFISTRRFGSPRNNKSHPTMERKMRSDQLCVNKLAAVTFLILLLSAFPLSAQVAGRLTGSVVDSDGRAVPGAVVNLTLAGGAAPLLTTVATNEGLFTLTGVRPDSYNVTIEASGFQAYFVRDVKIYTAQETVLPAVSLTIQPQTIRVEVTAAPQTIQTANAEVATTMAVDQVRRLP